MSEKKVDYTDKYRHIETPVKGSLDPQAPCRCSDCVEDDIYHRDLTQEEDKAVSWIFELLKRYEDK